FLGSLKMARLRREKTSRHSLQRFLNFGEAHANRDKNKKICSIGFFIGSDDDK
ncbi:hypothetical protein L9F63_026557, partial [Diploptera punctata]